MHSQKNSEYIKIYILGFIILLIMVNLADDKKEHLDEVALSNMATMINSGNITATDITLTGNLKLKKADGSILTVVSADGSITGKRMTVSNGGGKIDLWLTDDGKNPYIEPAISGGGVPALNVLDCNMNLWRGGGGNITANNATIGGLNIFPQDGYIHVSPNKPYTGNNAQDISFGSGNLWVRGV